MSVQCAACRERFGGVETFDRHRVRVPRNQDPDPPSNRCAAPEEMSGFGLVKDDRGVWRREGPVAKARKVWGKIEASFSLARLGTARRRPSDRPRTPGRIPAGLSVAFSGVSL
jgi:hypothetical protein